MCLYTQVIMNINFSPLSMILINCGVCLITAIRLNIQVFFAQMDVVAIIYTSSMLVPEIYCKNIYAVDLTHTNYLRCIMRKSIPYSESYYFSWKLSSAGPEWVFLLVNFNYLIPSMNWVTAIQWSNVSQTETLLFWSFDELFPITWNVYLWWWY